MFFGLGFRAKDIDIETSDFECLFHKNARMNAQKAQNVLNLARNQREDDYYCLTQLTLSVLFVC